MSDQPNMPPALNALYASFMEALRNLGMKGWALMEYGVPADDVIAEVERRLADVMDRLGDDVEAIRMAWDTFVQIAADSYAPPPSALYTTIKRLFADAKVLPGSAPAIECAVVIQGFPFPIQGSLSETPEGELRMLVPDPDAKRTPGQVEMLEHIFAYRDVKGLVVRRTIAIEGSRVVTS